MSSDADYASFLDKANQDTGSGNATTKSKTKDFKTKAVAASVPKELKDVQEYYVSDSDEPFEPVSLQWDGDKIPSKDDFAQLIEHDGEVEGVKEKDFDPRSQYKNVVSAVKKAGSGDVSVFRVNHGSTRSEYYVISLDGKESRLVGLKAVAIES